MRVFCHCVNSACTAKVKRDRSYVRRIGLAAVCVVLTNVESDNAVEKASAADLLAFVAADFLVAVTTSSAHVELGRGSKSSGGHGDGSGGDGELHFEG